jgi:hypothetical protein
MTRDANDLRLAAEDDVATLADWLVRDIEPRQLVDILMREAGRRAAEADLSREEMYVAWVSAFSAALIARADAAAADPAKAALGPRGET